MLLVLAQMQQLLSKLKLMAVIHNGQNGQCVPSHAGEVNTSELDHVPVLNHKMVGKPVMNKALELHLTLELVEPPSVLLSRI